MTIAHKTGLVVLAVALMAAALLLPPPPASADTDTVDEAVFAITGTAHLSDGVNSIINAPGCFGGIAIGAGTVAAGSGAVAAPASRAGAQFTYNSTPLNGDAEGVLWIEGEHLPSLGPADIETSFDWERTGVTALVDLEGNTEWGVAVAVLVPTHLAADLPLFNCTGEKKDRTPITHHWSTPGPPEEHVQIVGVGVITTECNTDPSGGLVPCDNNTP